MKIEASKHVCVVVSSSTQACYMRELLRVPKHIRKGINFVVADLWHHPWSSRAHIYSQDCLLLDHLVIEDKFRRVLELLHRWDKPSLQSYIQKRLGEAEKERDALKAINPPWYMTKDEK